MARWGITEWAVKKVEDIVDRESMGVSGKDGGFHLTKDRSTWDVIHNFSLGNVMCTVEKKGPILLRLLAAAAIPSGKRSSLFTRSETAEEHVPGSSCTYSWQQPPTGIGQNRRDPYVVSSFEACKIVAGAD